MIIKKKSLTKSQRIWVKLINKHFILKNMIKFIKIFLKKQSIKFCIFLNTKKFLISYKKIIIKEYQILLLLLKNLN